MLKVSKSVLYNFKNIKSFNSNIDTKYGIFNYIYEYISTRYLLKKEVSYRVYKQCDPVLTVYLFASYRDYLATRYHTSHRQKRVQQACAQGTPMTHEKVL